MDFPHFPFMPPDLSTHGKALDDLTWWVHIIMAILFVGWGAFFLYTLVRFRAGKNPKADHGGVKSHFSTYHEFAIVAIECVLLFVLAIPLWANWVDGGQDRSGENPLHIRVVGQQFAWNAQYPGPDGKLGPLTGKVHEQLNPIGLNKSGPNGSDDFQLQNQLLIPKNRPVIIQVSTKDVIRSFALPVMRVKQDAIPGMRIPIGFEAKQSSMEFKKADFAANPEKYKAVEAELNALDAELASLDGEKDADRMIEISVRMQRLDPNGDKAITAVDVPDFEIACAQLCGAQHFKMVGKFYIVGAEDFAAMSTRADLATWGRNFRAGKWDQMIEGQAGN